MAQSAISSEFMGRIRTSPTPFDTPGVLSSLQFWWRQGLRLPWVRTSWNRFRLAFEVDCLPLVFSELTRVCPAVDYVVNQHNAALSSLLLRLWTTCWTADVADEHTDVVLCQRLFLLLGSFCSSLTRVLHQSMHEQRVCLPCVAGCCLPPVPWTRSHGLPAVCLSLYPCFLSLSL
jgi:hypothetical protein